MAGSEFDIPCQMVVVAVGTRANPLLTQTTPDLKVNARGYIEIDADGRTSKPGMFAGGGIVRGSATVILDQGRRVTDRRGHRSMSAKHVEPGSL